MPTILDTLKKGTDYLVKHEVDEARLNMEHLVAHVLKVDRMQLYLDFDRPLNEEALDKLRDLTRRRSRGEPLQHLLGTVQFCDLEFAVDDRALVPRPETEELVARVLEGEWPEGARILDMGCGSGVIGLSLARRLADRNPKITLADISTDALALARENAESLGLEDGVTFIETDLFAGLDGAYDCMVANLPYVSRAEETELSREVLNDPGAALYGGENGTETIERFLEDAVPHLAGGGRIAVEFGIGQEETLEQRADDLGFHPVEVGQDLGGTPRFLFATKSA